MEPHEVAAIRGFGYMPSYCRTDIEWWSDFRHDTVADELARGKGYFPSINTVRIFLGYNSYLRDPLQFGENLEAFLSIASEQQLVTIPTLFNRWHTGRPDFGGIYVDHFLPRRSYLQFDQAAADGTLRRAIGYDRQFAPYIADVVGPHAMDPRISMWDLCNEPFFGPETSGDDEVTIAEMGWLQLVAEQVRSHTPLAPITVGTHALHGVAGVAKVADLCDVLSTHPYVDNIWYPDRAAYLVYLDELVKYSAEIGKPIFASETAWGSLDDVQRTDTIRFTLDALTSRGFGFLCYGLNHSLVADLHRPEFGVVGSAGSCAFIEADGRLRSGHEAFNEY